MRKFVPARVLFSILLVLLSGCQLSGPPPAGNELPTQPDAASHTDQNDAVTVFHGFGPARFGDIEEAVRMSWWRPLLLTGTATDPCRQLAPENRASEAFDISFMIEDGRFVRYDVNSAWLCGAGRCPRRHDHCDDYGALRRPG